MTERTDRLRSIMLSGEPFNPQALAEVARTSRSYPGVFMADLRALGYEFERSGKAGQAGSWTCLNPQHVPTEAAKEARRQAHRDKKARSEANRKQRGVARKKRKLNPASRTAKALALADEAVAIPPNHSLSLMNGNGILGIPGFERTAPMSGSQPPPFGEGVQVFAMALQDDGTLRLGIQNSGRKWVVDVIAEIAR